MRVGIIDADLVGVNKHRFPNLSCMKLSAYHKSNGDDVSLVVEYNGLDAFDIIYLSKVFTSTVVPEDVLNLPNIRYGGTGFFYDKAPSLPESIEHIMPDYHLYDSWINSRLCDGGKRKDYEYFLDYSIGFLTRGCFRQCEFCVNKNYKKCTEHSPIAEFYDDSRPKICFLDDNFFACRNWKNIIDDVKSINKPFQFKQGLDERLLSEDSIIEMYSWKYDGDLIFAFDNILDRQIIERNLKRIYEIYPEWKRHLKFYVFCGYDRNGVWDDEFYINDIRDTFERINILSKYSALPYIMRYDECYKCEYHGVYSTIAGWCNQPHIFKKFSYELYCKCKGMGNEYLTFKRDTDGYIKSGGVKGSAWRYMEQFKDMAPEIAQKYFSFIPCNIAEYGADSMRKKVK